jgi:hypothetical protein
MDNSNKAEQVIDKVMKDISKGDFVNKISTKDITDKYSVGMTIAREVLHKLVGMKRLIYINKCGFTLPKYNSIKVIKTLTMFNKFSSILIDDIFENYCINWASSLGKHPTLMKMLLNTIDLKNIKPEQINQLDEITMNFFMDSISRTGQENIDLYEHLANSIFMTVTANNVAIFAKNPEGFMDFYNTKLSHMEKAYAAIISEDKAEALKVYRESIKFHIKWHVKNS